MPDVLAPEPLVTQLALLQRGEQMTDTAFARRLGVHRVMWSLVRRGKRRAGRKMLDGAFRAYPELSFLYAQSVLENTRSRDSMHQSEHEAIA